MFWKESIAGRMEWRWGAVPYRHRSPETLAGNRSGLDQDRIATRPEPDLKEIGNTEGVSVGFWFEKHRKTWEKSLLHFVLMLVIFMEICGKRYFQIGGDISLLLGTPVKSKFDGLKSRKHRFAWFLDFWNPWEPLFVDLNIPSYFEKI